MQDQEIDLRSFVRVERLHEPTDVNKFLNMGWKLLKVTGTESPTFIVGWEFRLPAVEAIKRDPEPRKIPYPQVFNGRFHQESDEDEWVPAGVTLHIDHRPRSTADLAAAESVE